MPLYLVQHGLSFSKDADPKRGLTQKGIEETKLIAEVARGYNVDVTRIVHSGKTRAVQTAAIYNEILEPAKSPAIIEGINPLDDVVEFSATLMSSENLMIVGHLPFLSRLVSQLICQNSKTLVYRFQNSGIVCLDSEYDDSQDLASKKHNWFIRWTLNPKIS